ncbi:hypothetical protein SZN_37441, partial [Streptomyces zinciresistens K42]
RRAELRSLLDHLVRRDLSTARAGPRTGPPERAAVAAGGRI